MGRKYVYLCNRILFFRMKIYMVIVGVLKEFIRDKL